MEHPWATQVVIQGILSLDLAGDTISVQQVWPRVLAAIEELQRRRREGEAVN